MSAWFATESTRQVYDGRVSVRIDQVRTPDGETVAREIVEALDAVAVVALDQRGNVLLLKQYRQATDGYLLEIPAGVLDVEGEPPQDAVTRELLEETQHEAGHVEHLTSVWNSAGWTTERTHVYLATGCQPVQSPDGFVAEAEEAYMEVVGLPAQQAVAAARAGDIVDAKSVIGLLLAANRLPSA